MLDPGAALTEALLTKGPFLQHAWGLAGSGQLDRDPTVADPPMAADPATWWLRVERQTSIALSHLDRALFTIRLFVTPLPRLPAAQRGALAETVASMSPAAAHYKRLDAARRTALWHWGGATAAGPPPLPTRPP